MREVYLLNCPFCGGAARFAVSGVFGERVAVCCEKCGATSGYAERSIDYSAKQKAGQLWNFRAATKEVIFTFDQILTALRKYRKEHNTSFSALAEKLSAFMDEITSEEGGDNAEH